jgi:hypothetical protein
MVELRTYLFYRAATYRPLLYNWPAFYLVDLRVHRLSESISNSYECRNGRLADAHNCDSKAMLPNESAFYHPEHVAADAKYILT